MKKDKLPSIIILLILSLITALFWVVFSVYRAFTKPVAVDIPAEVLEPLNPTLDANTLSNLDKRLYIEEGEIQTAQAIATGEATSSPTSPPSPPPEESTSPSPTAEVSPTATP